MGTCCTAESHDRVEKGTTMEPLTRTEVPWIVKMNRENRVKCQCCGQWSPLADGGSPEEERVEIADFTKRHNPCRHAKIGDLRIGQKVRLSSEVRHTEYSGQTGRIKKIIKASQAGRWKCPVVQIALENGGSYEVFPANAIVLEENPPTQDKTD